MKNKINVFGLKKIFISLLLSLIFFWNSFAWNDFLQKKAERIIDSFSERVKKENPSEEKQIIIYRNIIATINKIKVKFSWDKLALLNFLIDEIDKKWELLGKTQTPVLTDYNLGDKNNDIEFDNDSNSENILDDEKKYLLKLFKDARNFSNKKEYEKAIKKYLEFLEIDQTDYVVYYNLWVNYNKINNPKKAVEYYKKALNLKSDLSFAYNNLGIIYGENNKNEIKIFLSLISDYLENKNINCDKLTNNQKKIYNLEYKRIKKYIDEKKFDELRNYAFKKYLN